MASQLHKKALDSIDDANKPTIVTRYADNGDPTHGELICPLTGMCMWSSYPEETIASGNKISTWEEVLAEREHIQNILDGKK